MLKIRRSHDRLIFNMGIIIPWKDGTCVYIEKGPLAEHYNCHITLLEDFHCKLRWHWPKSLQHMVARYYYTNRLHSNPMVSAITTHAVHTETLWLPASITHDAHIMNPYDSQPLLHMQHALNPYDYQPLLHMKHTLHVTHMITSHYYTWSTHCMWTPIIASHYYTRSTRWIPMITSHY